MRSIATHKCVHLMIFNHFCVSCLKSSYIKLVKESNIYYCTFSFINRTEEAVQSLVQGAHQSTSRLHELLATAKFMMQATNATHVNRAYFHVLKKACQSLEMSSRLEVCTSYLVQNLKNFVAILRENGN